jgi:hypothetical protein
VKNDSQFDIVATFIVLGFDGFLDDNDGTIPQITMAQNTIVNRSQPFFTANGNYAKANISSLCLFQHLILQYTTKYRICGQGFKHLLVL